MQLSTSFFLPVANEWLIGRINEEKYWEPATDQHGQERHNAWVIDASKAMPLKTIHPEPVYT
ncbi:hypothetical protein CQ018_17390 [Arthrobacter sp. MYb227]|nr:hypothetical protein CQ018_17390 [Arthrobacter sp. MYb227]